MKRDRTVQADGPGRVSAMKNWRYIALHTAAAATFIFPLQRYARIDLGVIIDLPWTPIRNTPLEWMKCNARVPSASPPRSSNGPHVAIGTIGAEVGEARKFRRFVTIRRHIAAPESPHA